MKFLEPVNPRLRSLECHITSDSHFGHRNIIEYTGCDPRRDELMIRAWHHKVTPDDLVLHLGDVFLPGGAEHFEKAIGPYLPGDKEMLMGNHDRAKRDIPKEEWKRWYNSIGFKVIKPFKVNYRGYTLFFTHRPGGDFSPYDDPLRLVKDSPTHLNIHGHIHERNLNHPRMLNVSVEQTDYSPVWLKDLVDQKIDELSGKPTST